MLGGGHECHVEAGERATRRLLGHRTVAPAVPAPPITTAAPTPFALTTAGARARARHVLFLFLRFLVFLVFLIFLLVLALRS